eukprot:4223574-Amphidinium_carterae.1
MNLKANGCSKGCYCDSVHPPLTCYKLSWSDQQPSFGSTEAGIFRGLLVERPGSETTCGQKQCLNQLGCFGWRATLFEFLPKKVTEMQLEATYLLTVEEVCGILCLLLGHPARESCGCAASPDSAKAWSGNNLKHELWPRMVTQ